MSYDFYFLRPERCADAAALHEHRDAIEARSPTTPETEAHKRQLAALLQVENPGLTIFPFDYEKIAEFEGTTVEQARQAHAHIELNGPDDGKGIQIILYSDEASITVPYWHTGAMAEAVFDEIRSYAAVLVKHGGYRICDPQIERVVDDLNEARGLVLERYASVMRQIGVGSAGTKNV